MRLGDIVNSTRAVQTAESSLLAVQLLQSYENVCCAPPFEGNKLKLHFHDLQMLL